MEKKTSRNIFPTASTARWPSGIVDVGVLDTLDKTSLGWLQGLAPDEMFHALISAIARDARAGLRNNDEWSKFVRNVPMKFWKLNSSRALFWKANNIREDVGWEVTAVYIDCVQRAVQIAKYQEEQINRNGREYGAERVFKDYEQDLFECVSLFLVVFTRQCLRHADVIGG